MKRGGLLSSFIEIYTPPWTNNSSECHGFLTKSLVPFLIGKDDAISPGMADELEEFQFTSNPRHSLR